MISKTIEIIQRCEFQAIKNFKYEKLSLNVEIS